MTTDAEVFDALKYHFIEVDGNGTRRYYDSTGQLHRDDGPAVEYADGVTAWYQNNLLHRTDGPAVEWKNGGEEWWQNGQLHRIDGPAIISERGDKYWYQNNRLHRTDGPAIEYANGTKSWHINGYPLTEDEFLAATQPVVEMTVADVEKLVGKRVKIVK